METAWRILEQGLTGGLVRVVAYVGILLVGLVAVLLLLKYIRWRVRRYFKRKAVAIVQAPVRGARALATGAGNVARSAGRKIGLIEVEPKPTIGQRLIRLFTPRSK